QQRIWRRTLCQRSGPTWAAAGPAVGATVGAGQRHCGAAKRTNPPNPVEQQWNVAGLQQRRRCGTHVADDCQRHMARGCSCQRREGRCGGL
ncbi:hypothetical protein GGH18_002993, partial [Coemansia sp. RSA 530]